MMQVRIKNEAIHPDGKISRWYNADVLKLDVNGERYEITPKADGSINIWCINGKVQLELNSHSSGKSITVRGV